MIALKTGKNYLLISKEVGLTSDAVSSSLAFMATLLRGKGQTCVSFYPSLFNYLYIELIEYLINNNVLDIVVLSHINYIAYKDKGVRKRWVENYHILMTEFIRELKNRNPLINIKVININKYGRDARLQAGRMMIETIQEDENFLLYSFPQLHLYKQIAQRSKAVSTEIAVVDNEIKKLYAKEHMKLDYNFSMERIKKMKITENISLSSSRNLLLTIPSLRIYPAQELGRCWRQEAFQSIKYLYEAVKHYYLGYDFYICETNIEVNSQFSPTVVEILDKRFITLLQNFTWGGPGYCHFGTRSRCLGEFSGVISNAPKYGLEYYLLGLKQYLTTANIHDAAGCKLWVWPLVDKDNNIVYSAILDCVRDVILRSNQSEYRDIKEEIREMTYDQLLTFAYLKEWNLARILGDQPGMFNNSYTSCSENSFLAECKMREPEVYEEIIKKGRVK